jgi:hypothetical protein
MQWWPSASVWCHEHAHNTTKWYFKTSFVFWLSLWRVNETGSVSFPSVDFGISSVEPMGLLSQRCQCLSYFKKVLNIIFIIVLPSTQNVLLWDVWTESLPHCVFKPVLHIFAYLHSVTLEMLVTVATWFGVWALISWTLGSWVWIPLKAWMFVLVFLCCAVLCRHRPCDWLITPPRSPAKYVNSLRNLPCVRWPRSFKD